MHGNVQSSPLIQPQTVFDICSSSGSGSVGPDITGVRAGRRIKGVSMYAKVVATGCQLVGRQRVGRE